MAVMTRDDPDPDRDDSDSEDETVGYKKPPKKNRISPGECRNPYGRRGKPKHGSVSNVKALPVLGPEVGIIGLLVSILNQDPKKISKVAPKTHTHRVALLLLKDLYGEPEQRMRTLKFIYARGYENTLMTLEQIRQDMLTQDDISPEVERQIQEMVAQYASIDPD